MSFNDAELAQASAERRAGFVPEPTVTVDAQDLAAALAAVDAVTDIRTLSYDELASKLITDLTPGGPEVTEEWKQETLS